MCPYCLKSQDAQIFLYSIFCLLNKYMLTKLINPFRKYLQSYSSEQPTLLPNPKYKLNRQQPPN